MRETEDIGARFAEEARRIHYGETRERPIRGRASPEETHALLEKDIPVMSLPLPPRFDGDWSSDVCSSDLSGRRHLRFRA